MAFGLSRAETASMMRVSPSTLASWENGKTTPQTATVWRVISELSEIPDIRLWEEDANKEFLRIFRGLAEALEMADANPKEQKTILLERDLSDSVLRAAQMDFRFSEKKKSVEPVPFLRDMELFAGATKLDISNLLDSLARTALELLPDLNNANINDSYLSRHLQLYSEECEKEVPNPRFLQRRGAIIRKLSSDPIIAEALNSWDRQLIEGFVDDHNELMRRYFGTALDAARTFEKIKPEETVLKGVEDKFAEIIGVLSIEDSSSIIVSPFAPEIKAIFWDLKEETSILIRDAENANSYEAKRNITKRALSAVTHSALLLGRLIYRTLGAVLSHGGNLGGLAAIIELSAPGSLRAAYQFFQNHLSTLPSPPF